LKASALTADAFTKLLACLDANRERAGERYEELRLTLTRFFEWRGAPFPEHQTDEVFDRVARKLTEGIEIRNIGGYCYEVARLVCLEALKGNERKRASLDPDSLEVAAVYQTEDANEKELRLGCLDECLDSLPAESRDLIVNYYNDDDRNRIERRKSMAESLGLQREALANRAQRIRGKLEQCVNRCLHRKITI